MHRALLALVVGLLLSAACGARTEMKNDEFSPLDAPPVTLPGGGAAGSAGGGGSPLGGAGGAGGLVLDAGTPDADASPDAPPDAPPDALPDQAAEAGCASAAQCDDGIACTIDSCAGGMCQHQPDDNRCDDGLFCTGVEVCSAAVGCQTIPVACDDGVACTVESCDEVAQSCVHTPDNALCPVSHKCGPTEGCYALAYAHSPDTLYEVRLPSGKVNEIGMMGTELTDLALSPSGILFGLSFSGIYQLDTSTGQAQFVSNIDATGMVALDAAPDGTFYAGGPALYSVDVQVGTLTQVVTYPDGYHASGDLAFLGGRLLSSASTGVGTDVLVEHDLSTQGSKILGPIGYSCVWGLAAFGDTLYGLTCHGEVLGIDPGSGAPTLLGQTPIAFWGASAR
jgi:hypothetical protein